MIARSGAGPEPIPYKSLNSKNLGEAIKFCLKPEVAVAAQAIADKMRAETGAEAAVQSFHRNFPLEQLPCAILGDLPATWSYTRSKKTLKLSGLAAEILIRHCKLDGKELNLHQSNPVIIKHRRLDILTGFSGVWVTTAADLVGAMGRVVSEPAREYQRAAARSKKGEPGAQTPAAAAAAASAESFLKLPMHVLKAGAEIPVAVADGFYAITTLCGDKVQDHGPVTDWKSGMRVGGLGFATSVFESVAGLAMHPYRGARDEGVIGLAKGVGKAAIGAAVKPCGAITGLVAYPLQGAYKSLYTATHLKTTKSIITAIHAEGEFFLTTDRGRAVDAERVLKEFDALMK